jgi:hypothetical protein
LAAAAARLGLRQRSRSRLGDWQTENVPERSATFRSTILQSVAKQALAVANSRVFIVVSRFRGEEWRVIDPAGGIDPRPELYHLRKVLNHAFGSSQEPVNA